MKISYDPQVDALYIRFLAEAIQVITQPLSEDGAMNYAPDRAIVGIAVLDASTQVFPSETDRAIRVQNVTSVLI
jgi:uncharacterized protein YuzE